MNEKLALYAELKVQAKEIETQLKALQPEIVEFMQSEGAKEAETDMGKFTLASKRKYEYPAEITALEKTLKSQKKEAEQKGFAPYTENYYITFKQYVG